MNIDLIKVKDDIDLIFLIIEFVYIKEIFQIIKSTYWFHFLLQIINTQCLKSRNSFLKKVLRESYIYILERTAATKLIFRCKNRDCKGKIMQLIDV